MLREVFLEPTWRDGQDAPAAPKPRQVSAVPAYCPPVDRSRLEEPADDRAALLSARLLLSAQSPPASPSALHWSRRPAAPHPPAFLTRAVQPKDLLTFGDQSAARGAGYAARGDWRRAFRSYVVAAEILRQLLAGDEPSQELRDRARRRLEVVLSIAEELKQAHPDLLLLSPSRRASEVAIARAWGDVDASTAGAQAVLAGEENRAGNALFKAGKYSDAVSRYTASLELDATQPHVHGNRSVAFLRTDDLAAALRDARAAVDLEPEAVARRAGVPLRRGVDATDARNSRTAAAKDGALLADGGEVEQSVAQAQRLFAQEVAKEVAELRACSIDSATARLLECAEIGDEEGLLRAIAEGAALDRGNPGWLDYTALHMAALYGHLDIARLLLEAGAMLTVIGRDGARPLHLAASPAMAVLLAEQPSVELGARDREGHSAVERLVVEQGWASEMLYEEGDVLICRPAIAAADIAAEAIGHESMSAGVNAHSVESCVGASLDPRHFRLCLVSERVRRRGGDGNQQFLCRWYHAGRVPSTNEPRAQPQLQRTDRNTTFVLDKSCVLVDRSDVFKRLRCGNAGAHGSLTIRGVSLSGSGGRTGHAAAMQSGTALGSPAASAPLEMVLQPEEWGTIVQTVVSDARAAITKRRQADGEAWRTALEDEDDRAAIFELSAFTPPTFAGTAAGERTCLLGGDGRPARLPPGAAVCGVGVCAAPSAVYGEKTAAARRAAERLARDEAAALAEGCVEAGEYRQSASDEALPAGKEKQLPGSQKREQADEKGGKQTEAEQAESENREAKALAALDSRRAELEVLAAASAAELRTTTVDLGLLPVALLFPHAEAKAAVPTLPADLAQEGAVSALAAGVSCQKINRNAPTVGSGTAFGWGARKPLPPPVDAKGFKAPTVDENFVTLRLNHSGVVSGGVRVAVKFRQSPDCRFLGAEPQTAARDPSRPWI